MKLILFTVCFLIKQRRTRRRGRLRILVLKIRDLALSLLARTSDSDSEEVGAVPTELAILGRLVQRSREHLTYNREMEYNRVRIPPSPTIFYKYSGREKRFPRLFHRQETFGSTPISATTVG